MVVYNITVLVLLNNNPEFDLYDRKLYTLTVNIKCLMSYVYFLRRLLGLSLNTLKYSLLTINKDNSLRYFYSVNFI